MEQTSLFYRFGAALAIGFLIGLQREYAYGTSDREVFAGERTFALMGLVGCTAAMAAELLASPWPFVGVCFLMGGLVAVSYFVTAWRGDLGLTTETAALVTVLAGALCYWDHLALAVATGGTLARRVIGEVRPLAIIAVACETDLTSGIQDSYPLPVYGVLNERPHGPCRDTTVNLDRVREAIAFFASAGR